MSYVDSVLQPGETVLRRGRLHWIVYVRGLLLLLLAGIILVTPVSERWRVVANWSAITV